VAGDLFDDHRGEHVVDAPVLLSRAGGEPRLGGGDHLQALVRRVPVVAVFEDLLRRAQVGEADLERDPAGVVEQLPDLDLVQRRRQVREVVPDRRLQTDLLLRGELQHDRRHEHLGDAADPEPVVRPDRALRPPVRDAFGAVPAPRRTRHPQLRGRRGRVVEVGDGRTQQFRL
jgi:hypothetical protein